MELPSPSTTVVFNHKIMNISQLRRESTPQIMVYDVPWKIEFRRISDKEGEWLSFYLLCENNDQSHDWSYAAFAKVELLSCTRKGTVHEDITHPFIFNYLKAGYGFRQFIKWYDLFNAANGYVKDDEIKLKIKIHVADPHDDDRSVLKYDVLDKCCDDSGLAAYRLTISNIDSLLVVQMPVFKLRDMNWTVRIYKGPMEHLSVYLLSQGNPVGMSCNTKANFKLVSTKGDTKSIEVFKVGTPNLAAIITEWSHLVDEENGFITNDTIVLEMEIKADKPKGLGQQTNKRQAIGGQNEDAKLLKLECSICMEAIRDQELSSLPCTHMFCTKCIEDAIKAHKKCPICNFESKLTDLRRSRLPFAN